MRLEISAPGEDPGAPRHATPGDLCERVAGALQRAHTLVDRLRSTRGNRLMLLGRIQQSTITALHGLVELTDETRHGEMPPALRSAGTWTGVAWRELEQQIHNARLPNAIVLIGHLSVAIARALSAIETARTALREPARPQSGGW